MREGRTARRRRSGSMENAGRSTMTSTAPRRCSDSSFASDGTGRRRHAAAAADGGEEAASVLPKQRLPRCPFRVRTPIDVEATSPSRDGASGGVSRPSAPRAPLCISRRVWHGASSSPPAAEAPPRGSPVSCVCVRTIGGGSSSAVTVQSGRISASDTVAEN